MCVRAISGLLHAPVLRANRWFLCARGVLRAHWSLFASRPSFVWQIIIEMHARFFEWQDIAEMHDFEQAWGAFAFAVALFSQLAVSEKE